MSDYAENIVMIGWCVLQWKPGISMKLHNFVLESSKVHLSYAGQVDLLYALRRSAKIPCVFSL